jgi:hypothetical protein
VQPELWSCPNASLENCCSAIATYIAGAAVHVALLAYGLRLHWTNAALLLQLRQALIA